MVVQLGKRAVAAIGGLPRRAVLAGGAAIAVALLISMVATLSTGDSSRGDARKPDAAAVSIEEPNTDDPEAPLEATETLDSDGYEGATPLPEPTEPEAYATGLPEPLIVASRPGTPPTSPAVDFPADGCDHDYGEPDQCIPWGLPEGLEDIKAKCAYLKPDGKTFRVRGGDRHRVDPDKNGIACDS